MTRAAITFATFALVAIGLLLAPLTLSGCARPLDTAIVSANAAHDTGDAAAEALRVGCTERYLVAKAEEVQAIDAKCIPAAKAYSAFRASHAALVAGIQAAQAGRLDVVRLLVLTNRLADAAKALSAAMEAIQ